MLSKKIWGGARYFFTKIVSWLCKEAKNHIDMLQVTIWKFQACSIPEWYLLVFIQYIPFWMTRKTIQTESPCEQGFWQSRKHTSLKQIYTLEIGPRQFKTVCDLVLGWWPVHVFWTTWFGTDRNLNPVLAPLGSGLVTIEEQSMTPVLWNCNWFWLTFDINRCNTSSIKPYQTISKPHFSDKRLLLQVLL